MKVFNTIAETQKHLSEIAGKNNNVGFVPTMGALHRGHLSLVSEAKKNHDIVVVSIFVNPIQFNDPKDLKTYPCDLEKDLRLLDDLLSGDDYVFVPDVKEIYPEKVSKKYDFGPIAEQMEGESRKGHFNGVGVVVDRLFRIIMPEAAYFGDKDFQQIAIIRKMVELEKLPVRIIGCPIIREKDGLAMSSRNMLLTSQNRRNAVIIYESMLKAKKLSNHHSVEETSELISDMINAKPDFQVEYVRFADEKTLQEINTWDENKDIRCFIAVMAGKIRLIDNIKIDLP